MERIRFEIWEQWMLKKLDADLIELGEEMASKGIPQSGFHGQREKFLTEKYKAEIAMEKVVMEAEELEKQGRLAERKSQIRTNFWVAVGSIIAALGSVFSVVLALPTFTKQINNIQVKVDSLSENIQQLNGRYVTERLCNELQNSFSVENSQNIANIKLKYTPISNSVSIWEGHLNLNPDEYTVENNIIKLKTLVDSSTLANLCNDGSGFKYVITYIKAFE